MALRMTSAGMGLGMVLIGTATAQIPFLTPPTMFSGPDFLRAQEDRNQKLFAATWQMLACCLTAALLGIMISVLRRGSKGFDQGWYLNHNVTEVNTNQEISVPAERNTGGLRQLYNITFLQNIPFCSRVTLGQMLTCSLFSGLVITMSIISNPTPLQNPRRTGFLAVVGIIIAVLLSMKNSPLSLVGKSYENINLFHRFVGRIVTVLVTLHGALFLKMYLNGMIKNMLAMYSGVAMWLALVLMSITSLKPIRRRAYSLFYWMHLLGYLTIFGVGMVHSPILRPYIGSAISLHLVSLFWQAQKVKFENATLTALPGKYVMIEIVTLRSGWKAGQHVRIRFLGDVAHCFEGHPFTIASHVGTHLVLYAKVVGSFTRTLYARAESAQNLGSVHVDFSGSPDVDKIHDQSSKDEESGIRDKKELRNSGVPEFTVKLSIQGYISFTTALQIEEILKSNKVVLRFNFIITFIQKPIWRYGLK